MDPLAPAVLARLPLAEAALTTWRCLADDAFLDGLFAGHRGRCYDRALSFPLLVRLLHDVLAGASPSAHRRFRQAASAGELPVSVQAAYRKLGRLPLPLSAAFLEGCTARLRQLLPDAPTAGPPAVVAAPRVVVLDGKAIKGVAKRLKPLRGSPGGLLGGRALVAEDVASGLVLALDADPDGEANELRLLPGLLPRVRGLVGGPVLWVADRQFGFPEALARLAAGADHFVVRYHGNVRFTADPARPAEAGRDAAGRPFRQEWGWLGGAQNRHRRYVRRITLERAAEEAVVLVTDLLDAAADPAAAVLGLYLRRGGIERVFQQVTEVFGLAGLIGGTPQAAVFQFAFCLVLYNLAQVLRAWVARAGRRPAEAVSTEKLFQDVTAELISWRTLLGPDQTAVWFAQAPAAPRERLQELLGRLWREDWAKARPGKRRPHPVRGRREHRSAYRLLLQHKQARPPDKAKKGRQDV